MDDNPNIRTDEDTDAALDLVIQSILSDLGAPALVIFTTLTESQPLSILTLIYHVAFTNIVLTESHAAGTNVVEQELVVKAVLRLQSEGAATSVSSPCVHLQHFSQSSA